MTRLAACPWHRTKADELRTGWIDRRLTRMPGAVPVTGPLPDVADHIIKAIAVRLEQPTGAAPRSILGTDVALLPQIGEQVDDLRQRKLLRRVVHVLLPDQMRFPVPPFYGRQPVGDVGGKSLTI